MLSFKKPRSTGWIIHKNVNYTTLANVDGVLFMLAGEKGAAALEKAEETNTRLD